jgi:signal transduction histidine kinase/ActR/RegA family two-component response regulator
MPWLRAVSSGLLEALSDLSSPWRRSPVLSLAAAAPDLPRQIACRQFRNLMEGSGSLEAYLGLALWVIALWVLIPGWPVVVWAALLSVSIAAMIRHWNRFERAMPADDALQPWEVRAGRYAFSQGVLWGLVGFMFPDRLRELAPYLAIGEVLVIAGALSTTVSYRPATVWLSVPCGVLTSLSLVIGGGLLNIMIGLGVLTATMAMTRLARAQNELMTRAMVLAEERVALLKELEAQREAAQQASLAKTRFLASVSHDLRQPMHSIALLSAALQRKAASDADAIVQIGTSVQAMDDMLGALLEVSRLDDGHLPLQVAPVALGPLFQRLALQFTAQAQAKGLELQVAATPARVMSDPLQLQRMLANLLSNAIRYTSSGRVLLRCRVRGAEACLQVWDTGVGIAREHRARVFEEFFQVARTPREGAQGLGLGLSIVHRLGHRLGHRLTLRSRPQRGSVFGIVVPLDAGSAADASAAASLAELLAGQLVLLIDDDATVRKSMQTLLESFGCHVMAAHSTPSALQAVDDSLRTPDLIITDYRLSADDTGLAAIVKVREAVGEVIPAVLITAEIDKPAAAAKSLGVAVLSKPLQVDALAFELNRFPGLVSPARGSHTTGLSRTSG